MAIATHTLPQGWDDTEEGIATVMAIHEAIRKAQEDATKRR